MPRVTPTRCINCGETLSGVSCVEVRVTHEPGLKPQRTGGLNEERMPKPGDATVCILCGHLMAFDENMRLRNLTPEEELKMAGDPALLIIQNARSEYIKKHGKIEDDK